MHIFYASVYTQRHGIVICRPRQSAASRGKTKPKKKLEPKGKQEGVDEKRWEGEDSKKALDELRKDSE